MRRHLESMRRDAMNSPLRPVTRDLVLVGGGHTHVAVLKHFGMKPVPGVRVTLISRESNAPYSGMLPGLIAGHYTFADAHIDLAPLARFARARFLRDHVVGVDLENKRVLCAGRPPVAFDVLSLNTGSAPGVRRVAGAEGSVVPVKPIDGFFARWTRLRERVAGSSGPVSIGIVGGGAGGVEIALSIRYGLARAAEAGGRPADNVRIELFTDSTEILPAYPRRMRALFARILDGDGIVVHTDQRVVRVDGRRLHFADGSPASFDELLWVTTAGAPDWPRESGLQVDERGFIRVRDTLQTLSHPDVFAAGDVAAVEGYPRPKAGVFAVRQGPPLARNLERRLRGAPLAGFRPQREYLSLVSTGQRHAVAARNGLTVAGRWVWTWKDRIDRRFIRDYTELPSMHGEGVGDGPAPAGAWPAGAVAADGRADSAGPGPAMRCGGCGSKVGSELLFRSLARLRAAGHSRAMVGLDAPDDAAVVQVPAGQVAVQSVDFFRSFVEDPFLFGRITANHALGDIFAMGARPLAAMAMVTLPLAAEEKMEEDLTQLMAGALEVLERDGAALVGGHTSEGGELAMGFSVTGTAPREDLLRKSGMRPGDRLVLTRPVGTGVIFAAEMRGRAQSLWIDAALAVMQESHRAAARIFGEHGATAATDVTGFGLAGHLLEMARASGVEVSAGLAGVPFLDGAREVAGLGIFSSLHGQNLRALQSVRADPGVLGDPATQLLFDPQTAGGLLASVPADRAEACVEALRAAGCPQAIVIGTVLAEDEASGTPGVLHLRAGSVR
jgi:selenide,water dikinase